VGEGKLLLTGIAGTVVTAICCATPVLAVVLGAVGLASWLGWTDYVLLPALAAFVGLTVYAAARKRRRTHGLRDQDGRGAGGSGAGAPVDGAA
jgi:mercuric ion transport protein